MRHITGFMFSCVLCLPAMAGRKAKKTEGTRGMLMPVLPKVMGDAWDLPPELSDRAQPGAVLEVTAAGYRRVLRGCIDAEPLESTLTKGSACRTACPVGWDGVPRAWGRRPVPPTA